jgi:hypothetical protein
MQLRRSSALIAGLLVLMVPGLASCGFDAATQGYYTPAAGANNRDGVVDVLGAVVVAGQPASGTFIASFSNNSPEDEATFEGLAGATGVTITVDEFEPVVIEPGGFVNLADDDGGVVVEGEFEAGDFLMLVVTFGGGETAQIEVPVVTACDYYEGLDKSSTAGDPEAYSCDDAGEPDVSEEPVE